ncbi:MAG TPA: GGDEF domain-containing protein, partial [Anaerolineaceae bacterium]|nr:GGDEF domain-containing protein [Anaerolineaceae bacterium]
PELIEKHDIGLMMFAIANINPDDQERIMRKCQAADARLVIVPDLLDSLKAHFPAREADRNDLFSRVLRNTTLDKLTGAYNRDHFLKLVGQELPRARRYGHPLSMLYLQVESPQSDTLLANPAVSAQVLKEVTGRIRSSIREIDLIGRMDEFQFAVLLPETELVYARMVANRLHEQIDGKPVMTDRGPVQIRIQSGITVSDSAVIEAGELIERTRQSLNATYSEVEDPINR